MPRLPQKPKPIVAKPKAKPKISPAEEEARFKAAVEANRKKEVERRKAGQRYANQVLGKSRGPGYLDRDIAADIHRASTGQPLRGRKL